MEVLQENMVVAILGKGDLVGYDVNAIATPEHTQYGLSKTASLLVGGSLGGLVKSSSDLKALTYCDLKCIHISGLLEVLKLYPEFSDTFHREIIHDLSFNLRETHEDPLGDDQEEQERLVGAGDDDQDDDDDDVDDDDEDDDDADGRDDSSQDRNGGGGFDGTGSRVQPSMGHLFRSITGANGGQQIGRYDHELDGAADEPAGENEISTEEDGDDEEEEEEAVENEDHPSGGGGSSHRRDGDGSGGGAHSANAPSSNSRQQRPDSNQSAANERNNGNSTTRGGEAPGSAPKNGAAVSGGRLMNGADCVRQARQLAGATRTDSGPAGGEHDCQEDEQERYSSTEPLTTSELGDHCERPSQRGRLMAGSGQVASDVATGGDQAPSKVVRNHSYDILIDCGHKQTALSSIVNQSGSVATTLHSGSLLERARRRSMRKNNSEELADDNGRRGGAVAAPLLAVAAPKSRLRSAIGGSGRRRADADNNQQRAKPPLSFDLSRNTTAIVDRRRRSAGCIPRPLLIGAVSAARDHLEDHHSSSLTHINEDQAMLANTGSIDGAAKSRRNQSSSLHQTTARQLRSRLASRNKNPLSCSQSEVNNHALADNNNNDRRQYASQDLKSINARICNISASVREMQQEIKSEMSQVRGAMQLMMQLLDKRVAAGSSFGSGNFIQSTPSLASSSTTTTRAPSRLGSVNANGGAIDSVTDLNKGLSPSKSSPLPRSQSTTSIPACNPAGVSNRTRKSTSQLIDLSSPISAGGSPLKPQASRPLHPFQTRQSVLLEAEIENEPASSSNSSIRRMRPNEFVRQCPAASPKPSQVSAIPLNSVSVPAQQTSEAWIGLVLAEAEAAVNSCSYSQLGIRPFSECSSSPLSFGQPNSPGQSNLVSDNDSGRSSSSMNMTHLHNLNPSRLNGTVANPSQVSVVATAQLDSQPGQMSSGPAAYRQVECTPLGGGSGRLAKMLIARDAGSDHSDQKYTIDIGED